MIEKQAYKLRKGDVYQYEYESYRCSMNLNTFKMGPKRPFVIKFKVEVITKPFFYEPFRSNEDNEPTVIYKTRCFDLNAEARRDSSYLHNGFYYGQRDYHTGERVCEGSNPWKLEKNYKTGKRYSKAMIEKRLAKYGGYHRCNAYNKWNVIS